MRRTADIRRADIRAIASVDARELIGRVLSRTSTAGRGGRWRAWRGAPLRIEQMAVASDAEPCGVPSHCDSLVYVREPAT